MLINLYCSGLWERFLLFMVITLLFFFTFILGDFLLILFFFLLLILMFCFYFDGVILNNLLEGDVFSIGLVILRLLVSSYIVIRSLGYRVFGINSFVYIFYLLLILFTLSYCFMTSNYFSFYVYFELVIVPVFFLVLGWGYRIERLQAGLYIFLYTLISSLPFLFLILYFYSINFTLSFFIRYFLFRGPTVLFIW